MKNAQLFYENTLKLLPYTMCERMDFKYTGRKIELLFQ